MSERYVFDQASDGISAFVAADGFIGLGPAAGFSVVDWSHTFVPIAFREEPGQVHDPLDLGSPALGTSYRSGATATNGTDVWLSGDGRTVGVLINSRDLTQGGTVPYGPMPIEVQWSAPCAINPFLDPSTKFLRISADISVPVVEAPGWADASSSSQIVLYATLIDKNTGRMISYGLTCFDSRGSASPYFAVDNGYAGTGSTVVTIPAGQESQLDTIVPGSSSFHSTEFSGPVDFSLEITRQQLTEVIAQANTTDPTAGFSSNLADYELGGAAVDAEIEYQGQDNTIGYTVSNFSACLSSGLDDTVASIGSSTTTSGTLHLGNTVNFQLRGATSMTLLGSSAELLLNTGRVAQYTGMNASGDLCFSYTVALNDSTADLQVTGLALNGSSLVDADGLPVDVGGIATAAGATTGIAVDATPVRYTLVSASAGTGGVQYLGDDITFTVAASSPLAVKGTGLSLILNDGARAGFTGVTTGGALRFDYKVGANDKTGNLTVLDLDRGSALIYPQDGNPIYINQFSKTSGLSTGLAVDGIAAPSSPPAAAPPSPPATSPSSPSTVAGPSTPNVVNFADGTSEVVSAGNGAFGWFETDTFFSGLNGTGRNEYASMDLVAPSTDGGLTALSLTDFAGNGNYGVYKVDLKTDGVGATGQSLKTILDLANGESFSFTPWISGNELCQVKQSEDGTGNVLSSSIVAGGSAAACLAAFTGFDQAAHANVLAHALR